MFTKSSLRFGSVFLVIAVILPSIVFAQGLSQPIVPTNCQGDNAAQACGVCDIATLAQNIVNSAIFIAVILSAILFAWAGVKMVGGTQKGISEGRQIFFNVVVGLVLILAAWLLIDTLFDLMTGNHLWSQVC